MVDADEMKTPDEALAGDTPAETAGPRQPIQAQPNTDTVAISPSAGRVRWPIPSIGADVEYVRDSELEEVVADLIEHYPNTRHLDGTSVLVYWKKSGRTRQGQPNFGGVSKPSPWLEVDGPKGAEFVFTLAADHIADRQWTGFQLEAFLYRLLCSLQKNEDGEIKVAAPDFAGYLPEVEAYGLWRVDLREAGEVFKQPSLFGE